MICTESNVQCPFSQPARSFRAPLLSTLATANTAWVLSFVAAVPHGNIPRPHDPLDRLLLLQDNLLAVRVRRHGVDRLGRRVVLRGARRRPRALDPRDRAVLGVQLELVQVVVLAAVAPPPAGVLAADCLGGAHGRAPAAVVRVGRVRVAGRAVDLEEAADEGFEEGCAGRHDADVELEAVGRTSCVSVCGLWSGSSRAPAVVNLLLPNVNPVLEGGVWAAARREHVHGLEDAHEDRTAGEMSVASTTHRLR